MVAILILLIVAFGAINAWTVMLFWMDKQRARAGAWRISEASLLAMAVIGGTPGAFLARAWFRHKTRKQPFGTVLFLIAAIQAGSAIGWVCG
ncbi:MAG TPA: DUF1294 domain-containing protein [Allosphingosinicella sp.]